MSYEATRGRGLGDLQFHERGLFAHGGSLYSPGGTTFGPLYTSGFPSGFGQCTEVPGGVLRCVQPPFDPSRGGLQKSYSWPPPLTPADDELMAQGCRPTMRPCGGPPGRQARFWCCPGGPMATVVGTPTAFSGTPQFTAGNLLWLAAMLGAGYFLYKYILRVGGGARHNPGLMNLTVTQVEHFNDALEHLHEAQTARDRGDQDTAWLHANEAKLHAKLLPSPFKGKITAAAKDLAS